MSLNLPRRQGRHQTNAALAIINIILLLVFFFLISGQNRPAPITVLLPETTGLSGAALPAFALELHKGGEWRMDGQTIPPELLAAALPPGDAPIHLIVDQNLAAGQLMTALRSPELSDRQIRLVTRHRQAQE